VWRNEPLPFHPAAEPAAEAAMEVRAAKGDKGFWDVHDKFFANQQKLVAGGGPDVEGIAKLASESGISVDAAKKAMTNHTHKKEIDADSDIAEDYQANGTPHFFVNGRRLVGAQPQEKFEALIDEQIKIAQDLVSKGTKPSEIYEAITKEGKGPPPPEKKDFPKGLPTNDPSRGAAGAKVTIHEWSDFQCPFCGRVEPTVAQMEKEYGDKVKFVWHDMPLPMHPDAPLAAQAAREAYAEKGPSAFWAMHDKMFANQQKIKRDDLDGYAKDLNLNMDKWKTALDGSTHSSEIDADKTAGGTAGISGTPAFLIMPAGATSGYFINGAQPYGKFHKLIERAFAEAR
jgi:protein-disulfide isomerase